MGNAFKFGVSTSSLQIEGTKQNFKTIWDMSSRNIIDNSNCDLACKFVDLYKEDIKHIVELGVDVYRMSLSWARIFPKPGKISKQGLEFYHQLFKELSNNGIEVDVTLYHWDMPLWLYEKGIGFHHPDIVKYFLEYAKVVFKEFDPYVRCWATLNEPWCISRVGYIYGTHAPFITNDFQKAAQADYYMLLAHQVVYDFYKTNYQKQIGIVLNVWGNLPLTDRLEDKVAAEYSHQFYEGVYLNPLFVGGYDTVYYKMLNDLNIDLSYLDSETLLKIKGKTDFLGINYYMHNTVISDQESPLKFKTVQTDYPLNDMGWEINPEGLRNVLTEIRKRYTDIPIYITENGIALADQINNGSVEDNDRSMYIKDHFNVIDEIKDTHNIQGYYVWSLLDNFEWHFGYTKRFGLIYVDYNDFTRTPKQSFYTFKKIISEKRT